MNQNLNPNNLTGVQGFDLLVIDIDVSKIVYFLALVLFAVLFISCATGRQTSEFLDSQLGIMTYEQSLQALGPPTNCEEAGNTRTCIWVKGSSGTVYYRVGDSYVAQPTSAPTAQLTFVNGVLQSWQLWGKWK